ncbi:hypothetical protein MKW98_005780 [Papaver atlanticum]|uniref:Neprosin PEP catalytic domain-containing protein n=1 Tax=Papaver atlanticum TaxID=357466 RepID=A0AAD4XWD7_9MAGN|nr:hypothetical protein MKW98_005780 [Papaver atlanticum]
MSKFMYLACWLLILTILINEDSVEGRVIMNKAIVKTIKVGADEIIDCYDIYKQPSLNHPLLRNHTIQMTPSSYPKGMKLDNIGTLQLTQTWQKYGSCPDRTVPIRKEGKNYKHTPLHKHNPLSSYETHDTSQKDGILEGHEYAGITMGGNFLGVQAKINLWKPLTETRNEMSVSQIWVEAGQLGDINTIELGWIVNPTLYGDDNTRFFIYWTAAAYNHSGCYNNQCNGFVLTTSDICLGGDFSEVSTLNGSQKDATFGVHKDQKTGHWWVRLQGIDVGYYPSSLFTTLSTTATRLNFGGEIFNTKSYGHHTSTEMGSGHLPSEGGLGTSSYFNEIQVVDENNVTKDPKDFEIHVTNPDCYDLKVHKDHTNGFGFNYGGPGYNSKCL